MTPPILYVAITGHGFGHVTRTTAVINEIQRRCPEITVIVATTAPRWLLDRQLEFPFIHRPKGLDIGVIQGDSVHMDKAATLERLRQIQTNAPKTIAAEVQFLRQNRVKLVLADMPPLAVAIAHGAGVPCWMAGNFGWDFIYRPWGGEFEAIADWISTYHAQCDRLFRLPFHEEMSAFPNITDVGLTGNVPMYDAQEVRSRLDLHHPLERTVLLTFGGLGLNQVPYSSLAAWPNWQFLTFNRHAPELPNLRIIHDHHWRPVDVMPLCDRIVAKPGYGTFAEACRVGTTVCTLPREDFAEVGVLLAGLHDRAYHLDIDAVQFFEGNWQFLTAPAIPPKTHTPFDTMGNETIATAVINYMASA